MVFSSVQAVVAQAADPVPVKVEVNAAIATVADPHFVVNVDYSDGSTISRAIVATFTTISYTENVTDMKISVPAGSLTTSTVTVRSTNAVLTDAGTAIPGVMIAGFTPFSSMDATDGIISGTAYNTSTACDPQRGNYCLTAGLKEKPTTVTTVMQMPSSGDPAASIRQSAYMLAAGVCIILAGVTVFSKTRDSRRI